jgi:AraC-like DNA-binding protein
MATSMTPDDTVDERVIELIASRVARALKDELAEIAAALGQRTVSESALTVDDVAERLGVSRTTVYTHWREWGGYKLGSGEKAAIRFSARTLPTHSGTSSHQSRNETGPATARRRPRDSKRPVLRGAPRLPIELGDEG